MASQTESSLIEAGFSCRSFGRHCISYFLKIKEKLSTAFYPSTDDQTKRQNSIINTYLWVFVNFEQHNKDKLLFMAHNNPKNASTSHKLFKLNCGYHPQTFKKEDIDLCSQSKSAYKLAIKLRELMTVCKKNLPYGQKLQKQYHDKHANHKTYALGDKIWLNSK